MLRKKRLAYLAGGALAAITLISLIGATTGGFPSRPIFQTVRFASDGTAAAPLVARRSDLTTGVYFSEGAIAKEVALTSNGLKTFGVHSTGATANSRAFLYSPRTDDLGGITLEFRENDGATVKGAMGFSDSGSSDTFTIQNFEPFNPINLLADIDSNINLELGAGGGLSLSSGTAIFTGIDLVHALGTFASSVEHQIPSHIFVRKTLDTSRASTTTPTDDPHLAMTIAVNQQYLIEGNLHVDSASATPDFKFQVGLGAGTCGDTDLHFVAVESVAATAPASTGGGTGAAVTLLGNATATVPLPVANDVHIHFSGYCFASGTANQIAVEWSQNTSDATATRLMRGSWMRATRLDN